MKAKFLPKDMALLAGNGEVVEQFVLGGSTRQLDTAQFYEYVEKIRQWAGEALDVLIPSPDDDGYGHGV